MSWKHACIILYIPIAMFLAVQGVADGVCNRTIDWFKCCPGYQRNYDDNTCIDCPNGTFGENCNNPCEPNFYGLRCLSECKCKLNEKCNRVLGCTNLTESQKKIIIIYAVAVVVIIACLLLGLSFFVWKQKMNMQGSLFNINILSCLLENRLFVQCGLNKSAAQEDDENHYSEIRESMMVRPMTVYGRQLSILRTSLSNHIDQYHQLSIKSSRRRSTGNNYVMVETNNTYIDPVDDKVTKIKQFADTENFKQEERNGSETQYELCENSFAYKTVRNKEKLSDSNQSLHERNKELPTLVCDYKYESDIYSYARYSENIDCEKVDQTDTLQDNSTYT